MASSASAASMEKLHEQLASIFTKTLKMYEARLLMADSPEVDEDLVQKLLEMSEPNPAMLNAISKFLKDNDIMYSKDEIDELSDQQKRLADLKKRRGNSVAVSDLKLVENE